MDYIYSFFLASSVEAWHSVPLISVHFPLIGAVFSVNNWLSTILFAVLILRGSHTANHSSRSRRNSAFSG
jgi:hypothetical protein